MMFTQFTKKSCFASVIVIVIIAIFSSVSFSADLKSATVLEFGPDNVLFVGDSQTGMLYAFETETVENETKAYGYNLFKIDQKKRGAR